MLPMTTTDYLINAAFLLLVARSARERELDRRSILVSLGILVYVAHLYLHSIPTAGNDLVLIGALASVGLALGTAAGFATHVRAGENGVPVAGVGWLAGALLVAGICSRIVFEVAVNSGLRPDVANFSIANHITAAAWPAALVLLAILEVTTRLVITQLRGREAQSQTGPAMIVAAA